MLFDCSIAHGVDTAAASGKPTPSRITACIPRAAARLTPMIMYSACEWQKKRLTELAIRGAQESSCSTAVLDRLYVHLSNRSSFVSQRYPTNAGTADHLLSPTSIWNCQRGETKCTSSPVCSPELHWPHHCCSASPGAQSLDVRTLRHQSGRTRPFCLWHAVWDHWSHLTHPCLTAPQ
ncbi:hypothetical protein EJ03DRAFT_121229 [Teratosphaeria nubilosa]|uniref:Uncharacterized protein n=1 Tax=Teratosphaeria nubilosa TaxID=161662 RepID=A0A6G1L6Q8_9PEZI|nr:hypothetical protein EJ03DRAFT_121229 [Teratosphaeria nubilosa]